MSEGVKETTFPFDPSLYAGHSSVQRKLIHILQPPTVAGIREVALCPLPPKVEGLERT